MAIAAVRAATPTDVGEIVRIQAETWAAAYASLVPAAAIEQIDGASGVIGLRVERESIRSFL